MEGNLLRVARAIVETKVRKKAEKATGFRPVRNMVLAEATVFS